MVLALEEFRNFGIDFISHQEALDTSTTMGEAMFAIIAAMAQLERSIIRERVQAAIAHGRLRATKCGRPIGRPRVVLNRTQAVELRAQGMSWGEIAKKFGTTLTSVRRAWKAKNSDTGRANV